MSENHNNHVSELLKKRQEIIERVKQSLPSEAAALEAIDMALDVAHQSSEPDVGPYKSVERGIDALVMHLRRVGKPMPRRQLVREVLAEGWAYGDPLGYAKLWDVIRYQWEDAKDPLIVKRSGNVVALAKKDT